MISFFKILKSRNKPLFYYGWSCIVAAVCCVGLMMVQNTQVFGINAWIKPFKFFISTAIFVFTMGWIMIYLEEKRKVTVYSWMVIAVFSFENIYISFQAAKGQLSHFNISSAFHGMMFSLMGLAITLMTLWTGYIGYLFFIKKFPSLPQAYVWGIRLGIVFFVIFAFEGGLMAARLAHTVGTKDGGAGLPLINWSTAFGDLRVAHFLGMHSLQLLPLFSYYVARNIKITLITAAAYFIFTSLLFVQALAGKPFIHF